MSKDFDFDELFSGRTTKDKVENDNQLLLPSGKLITFNAEQYEGVKKIRQWLKDKKNNVFTLAGVAGTGKSSIVKKILDDYYGGVVVSAPTHKAKKVIMNTTGEEGKTLHSLLGLRPDVNLDEFNPNSPIFNEIAIPKICDYNFVIIDEASMINLELYNKILDKIKNTLTKVLFVGDPAQIPPVGEKESVVFSQEKIDYHQLYKIERQKDSNPLLALYNDLRDNLTSVDGGFLRKSNVNNLSEGIIFTTNKKEFRNAMLEKFRLPEFQKNSDFVKTIAWRNETVKQSNKIIRTALIGSNTDIIEIGDLLMGYRTITNEQQNYNIIENSADYHVINKSGLDENKYGIKGFIVKIREDLAKSKFKFEDIFIIDSNNHDNLHLYAEMHDFFRDTAKDNKKMWKNYYEFRRNNLIMVTIDKHKNGIYRSNSDIIVKDLDYGYCITGHRSQGSTYNTVFVLENDIKENWVIKERNQIFYVSVSRPTTLAYVLCNKIDK